MPIGYPLLSTYLTVEDLRKLCAFQLVGQTGLIPVDFYLNLSGLRYSLKAPELYAYFKWATAAGVLTATGERAANGSAAAMAALGALDALGADGGAALQAARLAGNPFVAAMVNLNDFLPDAQGLAANLGVLAQVAAAREPSALGGLLVAKALAAVGDLAGFAPEDAACTGTAASLDGTVRHRLAASLYTLAMMAGVRARFGVELTAYRDATGPAVLDAADLPAAMANRVTLDPAGSAVVETKEWQALLLYLTTPQALGGHFLDGRVTNEYAGAAVWNRAPDYPSEALGRYLATLDLLRTAP